jgi:hydrogenase nickel incorporation protein HypA/HybF
MHELPIVENLLAVASQAAEKAGGRRVTDLYLVVGQLAAIANDSVRFYWEIVSPGTICAGARLHFERTAPRLRCPACGEEQEWRGEPAACRRCGGEQVEVVGGEEFYLKSIEVEEAPVALGEAGGG